MNSRMGESGQELNASFTNYYKYYKITDIKIPSPTDTWVFMDEHPDTINDGYFNVSLNNKSTWDDLPASYHNGAAGLAFADGHAEIRKWLNAGTKKKVTKTQSVSSTPAPLDIRWLHDRSTALR
jgi:prepilin-type processing-associated H-X9-DG protein